MNKTNTLDWWDKTHKEASTMARWMALFEAVNIVADKASEKGITPDKIEYKPKAIHEYIKSTQDIILKKILEQEHKIQICYSEEEDNFKAEII